MKRESFKFVMMGLPAQSAGVTRGGRTAGAVKMTQLTYDDVRSALGSLEDNVVAEILATGVSLEEFTWALLARTDHETVRDADKPSHGGVLSLIEIFDAIETPQTQFAE